MPEASHMVDDGTRVALLGTQHAHIARLVVRFFGRVFHQIFYAQQWSSTQQKCYFSVTVEINIAIVNINLYVGNKLKN